MVDGFVIGLLFAVCASIWVNYDAKGRNIDGASIYAWATLLVLIVGLPLYLYERSKQPKVVHSIRLRFCVGCGREQYENTSFCPYCGTGHPSM